MVAATRLASPYYRHTVRELVSGSYHISHAQECSLTYADVKKAGLLLIITIATTSRICCLWLSPIFIFGTYP
jgi:hypothetical protein